jgi:hypothetical protein
LAAAKPGFPARRKEREGFIRQLIEQDRKFACRLFMNRSAGLGPALGFRPAVRVHYFIDFAHRCFATR